MTHKQMWFQGDKQNLCVDCGEGYQFTCPKAKRTADEYVRGFYTHTGVINPNTEYDNYSNETPQFKAMKDVKVGDYVWLVCVPPKHRVLDVFAYNDTTLVEHSRLDSFAGIELELVTGTFHAADAGGNCAMLEETNIGKLTFPQSTTTDPAKRQFVWKALEVMNDLETWYGVGFKVVALPHEGALADIVGKIGIGAHTLACEAQTFQY